MRKLNTIYICSNCGKKFKMTKVSQKYCERKDCKRKRHNAKIQRYRLKKKLFLVDKKMKKILDNIPNAWYTIIESKERHKP